MRRLIFSILLLALVVLAGADCADAPLGEAGGPVRPPAGAAGRGLGVPVDFAAITRRVHLAFRPEGAAWTGGHGTYRARVDAGGVTVTPRHGGGGAPATFRTLAVGGEGARPLPARAIRADGEGGLAVEHGYAVELLRNTEDGLEQSFRFDRPPPSGAIAVRIGVSGQLYRGETARGLHFVDPVSGLGLRYGDAVWEDAAGRRTPLEPAWEDGAVVIRVPAETLRASTFPAVLDPMVSPELSMDTPVASPELTSQFSPVVAFNGTDYLVVWLDNRLGNMIFGTRVAQDGTVLDPLGIAVGGGFSETQANPAITSDGTDWMVVWDQASTTGRIVGGTAVSAAGAVSGAFELAAQINSYDPHIASSGAEYLVMWTADQPGISTNVWAQRMSPAGALLGATFLVTSTSVDAGSPTLAYSGGNYLAAWSHATQAQSLRGTLITTTGTVMSAAGTLFYSSPPPTPPVISALQVAGDGTGFMLLWNELLSPTTYQLRAMPVSGGGTPGQAQFAGAPGQLANGFYPGTSLTCGGGVYTAAWIQNFAPYGVAAQIAVVAARLTATGTPADPSPAVIGDGPGVVSSPALAAGSAGYLGAWASASPYHVYAARVTAALSSLDPGGFTLGSVQNRQTYPAVAFNGTSYLVVWSDGRGDGNEVWGTRVATDGTVLDPAGIALSSAGISQEYPCVASNGTDFLVAWEDYRAGSLLPADIYGTRVSAAGLVGDPAGIPISTATGAQRTPVAASSGSDYLVLWSDARTPANGVDLYGARVSAGAAVLDPNGIPVAVGSGDQSGASVAFGGGEYNVAWLDGGQATPLVRSIRVSTAGALLDAFPLNLSVTLSNVTTPTTSVFDGTAFTIGFLQGGSFHMARVTTGGMESLAAAPLTTSGTGNRSLGWDGSHVWAVWDDYDTTGKQWDVRAARISSTLTSLDGATGLPVSASPLYDETGSAYAGGPYKQGLVVYSHYDSGVQRVHGRLLTDPTPLGAACLTGGECVSGYCVDGVCCDTACGGSCVACTAAKKGSGASGTCGPIAAGTDPDSECAMQAASTCGTTGSCNGSGACALYASTVVCAVACSGGVLGTSSCNGAGTCGAPAPSSCAPYVCASATGCGTSCASVADCASGFLCDPSTHTCKSPVPGGGACAVDAVCQSTFCVDGVCCDTDCAGACMACSAAKKGGGADGTCGPVAAGTDPDGDCPADPAATCGRDGMCDGAGACARYAAGSSCVPGACVGGVATAASTCDGAGTCQAGAMTACAPGYGCVGAACATSCTSDTACAAGFHCGPAGTCVGDVPDAGGGGAGGSAVEQGGGGGSATSSGAGGSASGSHGCGCRVAGEPAPRGEAAALAIVGLVLARRGRRGRTGRRGCSGRHCSVPASG